MEQALVDAPPDWTQIDREILCPLCDYNLRGLVEPRCPECGHRFVWQDVLDDTRRRHRWLFEHQAQRRLRAFFHTLAASMLPRRFWRSVQPIHRPVVRRLLVYWVLAVVALVSLASLWLAVPIHDAYVYRQRLLKDARDSLEVDLRRKAHVIRMYGSVDAAFKKNARPLWQYVPHVLSRRGRMIQTAVPVGIGYLLWPWVTFAVMMVYRASMRQAKINDAHVLRCVIYTADGALLLVPLMVTAALWLPNRHMDEAAMAATSIVWILLTYRLGVAYRVYLRFPHAIAAVIASQIIVVLLYLNGMQAWGE